MCKRYRTVTTTTIESADVDSSAQYWLALFFFVTAPTGQPTTMVDFYGCSIEYTQSLVAGN